MVTKKKIFIGYVCVLVLLIILPINSTSSKLNNTYVMHLRGDYWMHILVFLPWMLFKPLKTIKLKNRQWFLIGILFAFLLEGLQYPLPYRAFNLNDAFANAIGVILGVGIIFFRKRQISK
jgi:glycopeptide antibiotics resistance protein